MKIHWISLGELHTLPDGTRYARVASARLRMLIPGAELERRGHRVCYHRVPETGTVNGQVIEGAFPEEIADQLHGDVVVFAKTANRVNERLTRLARQRGLRVVFDVCDHHFAHPAMGKHYQAMSVLADTIVSSTPALAEIIQRSIGRPARVIGEPYEGPRNSARFSPSGEAFRLLWFGHELNLPSLEASLPRLVDFSRKQPLHLTILTGLNEVTRRKLERCAQLYGKHLRLHILPWSIEMTWLALAKTDAVILPLWVNQKTAAKSPNRLVETLWAGRLPVAHAIPAYQAYADWAWVGSDLVEGLQWALGHADEIPDRIAAGQDWIAEHHAPESIADQWERVLEA